MWDQLGCFIVSNDSLVTSIGVKIDEGGIIILRLIEIA